MLQPEHYHNFRHSQLMPPCAAGAECTDVTALHLWLHSHQRAKRAPICPFGLLCSRQVRGDAHFRDYRHWELAPAKLAVLQVGVEPVTP